jgi:cephalosporin-C deacetylase
MTRPPYNEWFGAASRDGTYGYDLDGLLTVEPIAPTSDFPHVWRRWFAEALTVPSALRLTELTPVAGREVYEIEYTVSGGLRIRAWLALPVGGQTTRIGVVHGHGYGGRDHLEFSRVPDNAAVLFTLARGLGVLNVGVGAPLPDNGHVLFGIESIERYVLGRCAVDLWHAASALIDVIGEAPLYYIGESFGGGIGALAVPWDNRFAGATLVFPSFGHYDLRLRAPCDGSGERVRAHVAVHPEAREVLRYFDASTAAGFLCVPVRVECALWDNHVPPPGQFAVANAVARAAGRGTGAALELDVQAAGHIEYPGVLDVRQAASAATRAHIESTTMASHK